MLDFLKRILRPSSSGAASTAAAPTAAPASRSPLLTPRGLLDSDLWIDQPNAGEEIDRKLAAGELTEAEAEKLHFFVENGYLTLSIDVEEDVYEDIEASVDRLWEEKPGEVAFAYHSELKPFSRSITAEHRKPSCRIADLHPYSEGALDLYLNETIHRYVRTILGKPAVATQSLYFQWGSQQNLHRDPVYVQMQPPAHLVAAWIALEDIDPRSGPLIYVPGSQRLPYYALDPGDHRFDHSRHGNMELEAMASFDREQIAEHGLEVVPFTPKKGEVLIWHHSLLHGGSFPQDPSFTRKSFVVHFSSRDTYHTLRNTYLVDTPRGDERRVLETQEIYKRGDRWGFDSPLHAAGGAK